jgi:hypothetical protein
MKSRCALEERKAAMSDYDRYDDTHTRSRREEAGRYGGAGERSNFPSSRTRRDWGRDRGGAQRSGDYEFRERDRSEPSRSGGHRRERIFSDSSRDRLPIDETSHLIASNKVEGTAVYGRDDRRLGSVYNFMVDKYSGRVEYAVMAWGGMLGMGNRYYPLPWQVLTYDVERGGYRVPMTERDLRDAPSFDRETEPRFDRRYGAEIFGYYGLNY